MLNELAVDPIEGGCANNYTYVSGDPINSSDVSGKDDWWNPQTWWDNIVTCDDTAASQAIELFSLIPPTSPS